MVMLESTVTKYQPSSSPLMAVHRVLDGLRGLTLDDAAPRCAIQSKSGSWLLGIVRHEAVDGIGVTACRIETEPHPEEIRRSRTQPLRSAGPLLPPLSPL